MDYSRRATSAQRHVSGKLDHHGGAQRADDLHRNNDPCRGMEALHETAPHHPLAYRLTLTESQRGEPIRPRRRSATPPSTWAMAIHCSGIANRPSCTLRIQSEVPPAVKQEPALQPLSACGQNHGEAGARSEHLLEKDTGEARDGGSCERGADTEPRGGAGGSARRLSVLRLHLRADKAAAEQGAATRRGTLSQRPPAQLRPSVAKRRPTARRGSSAAGARR